jgi:hypothetical protein
MHSPSRYRAPLLSAVLLAALFTMGAPPLFAQKRDPVEREFGRDRFTAGGTVSVTTPVPGDLIAAGGHVDVAAEVGGDAVVAGGNVRMGAPVGQGLYAAGGRVSLHAPVQRNARVAGGNVEISPQAKIAGGLTVAGGEVRILGGVDGYVQAAGGEVFIDAPIGGNVELAGGRLELGPNARIGGRLRYASRNDLRRDAQAQVEGGIERFAARREWPMPLAEHEAFWRGLGWVWSAGLLVIAAILVAALPAFIENVTSTVRARWAWSMLIGFIALVCIPAAALLAIVSIIGVPFALVAMALYPALLVCGYLATGIALGELSLRRLLPARATHTGWRVAAALVGTLVVSLLSRIPWLGGLVVFIAMLIGSGALLLQVQRGVARWRPS